MALRTTTREAVLADLSLTQLTYIVAVDTHGHFGRAAAACHVTQPTLSMQIGKLERALGVTIFDRSRSPVLPTDVGRLILDQAHEVLRAAARIPELCAESRSVVAGELRLGVIPTLAPYLLPRFLDDLTRRNPQLELAVEEMVTSAVVAGLRQETLDVGLIATPLDEPGLTERVLFAEPFVAYISAGHRLASRETLTPDDLSLDDLWLLSEGHCFRAQMIAICGERAGRGRRRPRDGAPDDMRSCTRRARFESGNLETLKRLVERGEGMTLLPALAVDEMMHESQRALVHPFAHPAPTRQVRLVQRRADLKRRHVDALVDAVMRALPAELRA
ncbi:MAG TPA: LysR substrate-binding domain-containing protein [Gemmatimonadaceae bacterium]|nr:LysR substrate-binding domain-containing protein [Gemmatimonadaceae bacterium]